VIRGKTRRWYNGGNPRCGLDAYEFAVAVRQLTIGARRPDIEVVRRTAAIVTLTVAPGPDGVSVFAPNWYVVGGNMLGALWSVAWCSWDPSTFRRDL